MSGRFPAYEHDTRFSLLRLSADSLTALEAQIAGLRERLRSGGQDSALIQSPGTGAHRFALLCQGRRDALAALEGPPGRGIAGCMFMGIAEPGGADVVFLFPGLGDHRPNMALQLYQTEEVFRKAFERCADIAQRDFSLDLRALVYPEAGAGDEVQPGTEARKPLDLRALMGRASAPSGAPRGPLDETAHAQPALFAVEYALARLWQSCGVQPSTMMGYSLGEYVAACLAGVLSLDEAVGLVVRRARLIQELPAGSMLAVSASPKQITPLLGELSLSAINGSELCVVAGPSADIDALHARLTRDGIASRPVKTTHAFHSSMMAPVEAPLTRLLAELELRTPEIPYISNVTGALTTAEQAADPAHWTRHSTQPVRYADGLRALARGAGKLFLEVGPGQTLTSLTTVNLANLSAEDPRLPKSTVLPSLGPSATGFPDRAIWLLALARLWVAGAPVDDALMARATVPAADELASVQLASAAEEASAETSPDTGTSPMSAVEQAVAAWWRKLLGAERLDLDSDFFELGGNSLLASQLVFHARRQFRVTLSLRALYRASTLREQAALIEQAIAPDAQEAAIPKERPAAWSPPASAPAHPARLQAFRLPNGLEISHQSEAETRHFFADIFTHRGYLRHGLRLRDGACVFDVGANIGLFTLFAHLECRDARIFSFEPAPVLFAHLSANAERHQIAARLCNYGLSRASGDATFTFYPRSSGMSSFHADDEEERAVLSKILRNQQAVEARDISQVMAHSEELLDLRLEKQTFTCRLRTLSEVIAEHAIQRIDFLKIDVQKAEYDVLLGLQGDDWPKVQQVAMEVHDIDGRVGEARELLASRGFSVEVVQDELYRNTNVHNLYARRR